MRKQPRILVIDDDEGIRRLYQAVLGRKNYRVTLASSTEEALAVLSREKFDLVLLDLQMPGSDGFVFLDRLQQYEQPPAVVVSSGLATVENAVKAVRLGAKDFIVKPFKVEQLLQTIERTLTIEALTAELSDLQMVRSVLELSTAVLSVTEVEPLLERLADLLWNLFKPEAIFFFIRSSETANFILRKYRPQPQPERISLFLSEEEVKKELGGERVGMKELSGKRQLLALLQGQGRELGVVRFDFP
ncbi:MAG TPA: response regulator, partial [bacterium]|nr:response regulator [bacterium]